MMTIRVLNPEGKLETIKVEACKGLDTLKALVATGYKTSRGN